jgi:hypothetical protein
MRPLQRQRFPPQFFQCWNQPLGNARGIGLQGVGQNGKGGEA